MQCWNVHSFIQRACLSLFVQKPSCTWHLPWRGQFFKHKLEQKFAVSNFTWMMMSHWLQLPVTKCFPVQCVQSEPASNGLLCEAHQVWFGAVREVQNTLATFHLPHTCSGMFILLRNHCNTPHSLAALSMQMWRAQNTPTPGLQHWILTESPGRNTVSSNAIPSAFPKEQKRNFFYQFECEPSSRQ